MSELGIRKAIINIIDTNLDIPVLSNNVLPLNAEVEEFIFKHIEKTMFDDALKKASFRDFSSNIPAKISCLIDDPDLFIPLTKEISTKFFEFLKKNPIIDACDLLFSIYAFEDKNYFAIFKMTYKDSFIHYVDGQTNSIVKQKTTLPMPSQKIDEAVIIDIDELSIDILEKKVEVNGEKVFYLSEYIMEADTNLSVKDKVKIFEKTSKKFKKEFMNEGIEDDFKIKDVVSKSIEEKGEIDIDYVANNLFEENSQVKDIFIDSFKDSGIEENKVPVSEKIANKTYFKQKIKTDNGIDISLPTNYCTNKDLVEFVNNSDGSVSIIIKNVKLK